MQKVNEQEVVEKVPGLSVNVAIDLTENHEHLKVDEGINPFPW